MLSQQVISIMGHIQYSEKYFDDTYQHMHVLPPEGNTHGEEEDGESIKLRFLGCYCEKDDWVSYQLGKWVVAQEVMDVADLFSVRLRINLTRHVILPSKIDYVHIPLGATKDRLIGFVDVEESVKNGTTKHFAFIETSLLSIEQYPDLTKKGEAEVQLDVQVAPEVTHAKIARDFSWCELRHDQDKAFSYFQRLVEDAQAYSMKRCMDQRPLCCSKVQKRQGKVLQLAISSTSTKKNKPL